MYLDAMHVVTKKGSFHVRVSTRPWMIEIMLTLHVMPHSGPPPAIRDCRLL